MRVRWIASYPKSGNTWVRFLVANLLTGGVARSTQVEQLIPGISIARNIRKASGRDDLLAKTHWRFSEQMPLRANSVACVYIVRHPLDVLVSNLNYFMLTHAAERANSSAATIETVGAAWIDRYIEHGGEPRWIKYGFGTWEENVDSWTSPSNTLHRLILRYEDMKADAETSAQRIARFLAIRFTEQTLRDAVAQSQFAVLREMEERELLAGRKSIFMRDRISADHDPSIRFMNRGAVGAWRSVLSEQQQRRGLDCFARAMEKFGYS